MAAFGCSLRYIHPGVNSRITRPQPKYAKRALKCGIDFFISYRISEAERYSLKLSRALKGQGYKTFMAGEQNLPVSTKENDENYTLDLEARLGAALRDSLMLILVGSKSFPDTEWLRWENETFEHDREGKMLPIATLDSSHKAGVFFRFLQERDGAALFEGYRDWRAQEPSDTVIKAVRASRQIFQDELEFQLIATRWPENERAGAYFRWMKNRRL